MELGDIGEILRSYPWKCIECKICEICQEKGDDVRIVLIPSCDISFTSFFLGAHFVL